MIGFRLALMKRFLPSPHPPPPKKNHICALKLGIQVLNQQESEGFAREFFSTSEPVVVFKNFSGDTDSSDVIAKQITVYKS